jgi:hypothetical protein
LHFTSDPATVSLVTATATKTNHQKGNTKMTYETFKNLILAMCPNAIITQDEYGEMVIDTGMSIDEDTGMVVAGESSKLQELEK